MQPQSWWISRDATGSNPRENIQPCPLKVDKFRCKSYHRHLPSNELGFINIMINLEAIEVALDDASSVVFALKAARENVSEKVWDTLPEHIQDVLDCASDLESSMQMEDVEG